jgi:hypothetical protein
MAVVLLLDDATDLCIKKEDHYTAKNKRNSTPGFTTREQQIDS